MTAKEYLQQIRKLDRLIDNKQREIQNLYALATRVTPVLKSDVVQASGNGDKIGDAVTKIVMLQNEINETIDKLVDTKREAIALIDMLDGVCSDLLYKRYVQYKTWEQIAVEMDFSYQWVCELHGRALKKVQHLIEVDIPK